jgi:hypothetical protein
MVKLVQISKRGPKNYQLESIYVNPKHIIFMSEHRPFQSDLVEGKINLDIDKSATFTKIKLNENSGFSEIVVVGAPELIETKIFTENRKTILRG